MHVFLQQSRIALLPDTQQEEHKQLKQKVAGFWVAIREKVATEETTASSREDTDTKSQGKIIPAPR